MTTLSSPEETRKAADLIERLLTDAAFRAEFRRNPAGACERFGLTDLAQELRGGSGAKALYTLELRQSMSSLAGVIMAAAAEGIGALELAGYARADDKRVAGVVNEALSRTSIKAISQAELKSVRKQEEAAALLGDGKAEKPEPTPKPAAPVPSPEEPHVGGAPARDPADAGHEHGPSLADAGGPAVTPSDELAVLLDNPNLELPAAARADLQSGRVDPRLVSVLTAVTKEHKVALSVVVTGHDQFTSGGSVSNHYVGRGIDIASVDGEIVRPSSIASRELAEALVDLPESIRPTEVGTPWAINAPGFFTDGGHQDHLHVAFDGPAPEGFASPVTPVGEPAVPAPAGPKGGSGVFAAATSGSEGARGDGRGDAGGEAACPR